MPSQQMYNLVRSWGNLADNPDNCYGYGVPDFGRYSSYDSTANISNEAVAFDAMLSPNPATGVVTLQTSVPCRVCVMDITGRPLGTYTCNNSLQLSVLGLRSGVYLVCLTDDEGSSRVLKLTVYN